MSKYYVVAKGRNTGIYSTWKECERQVKGYSGAVFRKFDTEEEAKEFLSKNEVKQEKNRRRPRRKNKSKNEENKGIINEDDLTIIKRSRNYIQKSKQVFDFKHGEAVAYVDGSYSNQVMAYSYGIVYFDEKGKRMLQGKGRERHLLGLRNISGELKSAAVAMHMASLEGKRLLYLHYDYEGIEKWATKEWGANNDGAKAYQKFFDSIKGKLDVVFIKVESKSGVIHHDEADRLASWAMTLS